MALRSISAWLIHKISEANLSDPVHYSNNNGSLAEQNWAFTRVKSKCTDLPAHVHGQISLFFMAKIFFIMSFM